MLILVLCAGYVQLWIGGHQRSADIVLCQDQYFDGASGKRSCIKRMKPVRVLAPLVCVGLGIQTSLIAAVSFQLSFKGYPSERRNNTPS